MMEGALVLTEGRHDRGVGDAQALHAVGPQPVVRHGHRSPSCRCRPGARWFPRSPSPDGVDYIVDLPGNAALRGFASFDHAAGSWNRKRRVVARLEATTHGFDARYTVTSLTGEPRHLYEGVCCARVVEKAARNRIHFASACPDAALLRKLAGRLAASGA